MFFIFIFISISSCSIEITNENNKYEEYVVEDGYKYSNNPFDFVLLTDVVPDVILEIRYYSTYNFVGSRIDDYE